jgi:hypothetical protein
MDMEETPNIAAEPICFISKSKFIAGLQCPKREWLQVYRPELAVETATDIKEQGSLVGKAARDAFRGGVLVDIPSYNSTFDKAAAETKRLMEDPNVQIVFEGAFSASGVRVRVDVLIRRGDGWSLGYAPVNGEDYSVGEIIGEVKASTKVKESHIWDASLQAYILRKCGVNVPDVAVIHLNRKGSSTEITGNVAAHVPADTYAQMGGGYIWDGAMNDDGTRKYNFAELFVTVPITPVPDSEIVTELNKQFRILGQPTEPSATCGSQCTKPYACEFAKRCHEGLPIDDLVYMPNVFGSTKWSQIDKLRNLGVVSICSIDSNKFPKTKSKIERVQDAFKSGSVTADSQKLVEWQRKLKFPINFLDYETVAYALPNIKGTKPWDAVPMQLSNHRLDADGTLTHQEFLGEADGTDPRVPFIEVLLAAVGTEGTIVTYSMFEFNNVNEPLAKRYPQYAERLRALKERAWDMCAVVKDCVYHPKFRGSFSIKTVLPVLVPGMSYENLAIGSGIDVSPAWDRLLNKCTPAAEHQQLRVDLLAYCGQDTMAMVQVLEVLVGLSGQNVASVNFLKPLSKAQKAGA